MQPLIMAVRFVYVGGLSVTKYFSCVVGNNCQLGLATYAELGQFSFQNTANDYVYITSNIVIDKVEIYNMLGKLVSSTNVDTNKVDIKNLSKGIYLLAVYSGTQKSVKKLKVE